MSGLRRLRRLGVGARYALALSGLAALSGCGWFSSSSSEAKGSASAACPTVAILRPLSQTAVFAPGAPRQPTGVAFYGVLSDVESSCTQVGDAVRVALNTIVIGERGPTAGSAAAADLYYFVAVTGPDQTILSKRTLPLRIAIPANVRRAGVTDRIEETIPLGGRPPGELNVLLGFQQSPEAVEFYRNYRGR